MNERKLYYPLNVIVFNLCRLWPFRDKRTWVFGAIEGKKFDENSRYLFEYLQKKDTGLRLIWMTNDEGVVNELRNNHYEAYLNRSWKGKYYQLRAGVAIYTHGLIDFGRIPLVGGAEVVSLWHGVGFKKIYNAAFSGKTLVKRKIYDFFYTWTYRTMTLTTSKFSGDMCIEAFSFLKQRDIYYTGQPRNDIFRSIDRNSILQSIGIDPRKKVIIYMPTYRKTSMGVKSMQTIVENLYHNEELNNVLDQQQAIFVCKLHPLTPTINLEDRDNFRILDYKQISDNQALMGACEMLVTDYSSCFIDYALLNRPIILYYPDDKAFLSLSESMKDEFFEMREPCMITSIDELSEAIKHPSLQLVDKINEMFVHPSTQGTCFSENAFLAISSRIGL